MEETLEALHEIVKAGKARYIAASNMVAWQFTKALYLQQRHGWMRFVAMQNQYNLVYREEEREMIPLCLSEGIGYTPYSPLARGFLAGKGSSARAKHDPFIAKFHGNEADAAIAPRESTSNTPEYTRKGALAWFFHQPRSRAVIGAPSPRTGDVGVSPVTDLTRRPAFCRSHIGRVRCCFIAGQPALTITALVASRS